MSESSIFHLITSDVWAEQSGETVLTESTRGASLEQIGYIHCSYRDQVEAVANAVYADLTDPAIAASALLLLEIDSAALDAEIRVENTEGGDETFPHVYGAVPIDAITAVHEMVVGADGRWQLPRSMAAITSTNLAGRYDLPPFAWDHITTGLDRGFGQAPGAGGPDRHTCWLATINADGSPHLTGVGALWVDDAFWFETGPATRKARNIERDARCTLSLATRDFDLVLIGRASVVTNPLVVAARATDWAAGGWPCEVDESGVALTAPFSAPSAGAPPWHVYRIAAESATAVLTVEPGGATTFTF